MNPGPHFSVHIYENICMYVRVCVHVFCIYVYIMLLQCGKCPGSEGFQLWYSLDH